jgi:twinkle protein
MADFVRHEPCPSCGSKDNLARYSDGSASCFTEGCKHYERGDGTISEQAEETNTDEWDRPQLAGEYKALANRDIDKETCEFARYQVGEIDGKACHIANHYEGGKLIAQKIRLPGKQFTSRGPRRKTLPFYMQWLWNKGKHLVITEGEIDALSMLKAFERKWPVVSLPNGTGSAKKAIEQQYEWLEGFDRIVLMFDMDEPGQKCLDEVAPMLPPGKVAIASLPEKDANEVLKKHGPGALIRAFWDAKPWRPDGIISGEDISLEELMAETVKGYEYPQCMPLLQEKTLGLRKGEITLLTAGSGIGKSTWAREIAYDLQMRHGCRIGNCYLEENHVKTAQGYIAIHNNVPLGRLRHNTAMLSTTAWTQAKQEVVNRMHFHKHFGSLESKSLISRLRYFATVCKVDFIVLDHISIVTSGMESSSEGERKDIDILMTRLRALCEETGVGIIAIVHLKRTEKNFNEGAQVALSDLRGSGSLEQLSDNVIALERDQQGERQTEMRIRILKCREMGETGESDLLNYNRSNGRIEAVDEAAAFEEV